MASTGTRAQPKKWQRRRLNNAALLKLAATRRPPQSWYDDTTDPTKPQTKTGRGR